jgi:acyl-CoA-binding protein
MSTVEEAFSKAVNEANALKKRPDNKTLLKLYGLFKQATQGDCQEERPKGFDFKAAAKWEAWKGLQGISREEAMKKYVGLVENLSKE